MPNYPSTSEQINIGPGQVILVFVSSLAVTRACWCFNQNECLQWLLLFYDHTYIYICVPTSDRFSFLLLEAPVDRPISFPLSPAFSVEVQRNGKPTLVDLSEDMQSMEVDDALSKYFLFGLSIIKTILWLIFSPWNQSCFEIFHSYCFFFC